MPKAFGYLNQNNPMTIGDTEAQEMINCSIEHGWIEYRQYPVFDSKDICVPNRMAKLPNKAELKINATEYGQKGAIRMGKYPSLKATYKNEQDIGVLYFRNLLFDNPNAGTLVFSLYRNDVLVSPSQYNHYFSYDSTVGKYFLWIDYTGPNVVGDIYKVEIDRTSTNLPYIRETTFGSPIPSGFNPTFSATELRGTRCEATGESVAGQSSYKLRFNNSLQYNSNTKKRFKRFVVVVYYSDSEYQIYDSNNYTIQPGTGTGGAEDGSVELIFNYPIQSSGKGIVVSAFYYTNENDFLITVPGSDSGDNAVTIFYMVTAIRYGFESPALAREVKIQNNNLSEMVYSISMNIQIPQGYDSVKVYRMPVSVESDAYLLVKEYTTNYSGEDTVQDLFLTDILQTEGNTFLPLESENVNSIILHKDMLFLAIGNLVYFSKIGIYDQFPAENFLAFPEEVIGFCKHYSYLMIFTTRMAYILYGDSPDSFSVDDIDYKIDADYDGNGEEVKFSVNNNSYLKGTAIANSAQSIYGKVICLAKNHSSLSGRTYILLVNSRYGYDITNRVRKFFDYMMPSNSGSGYAYNSEFIDNVNRNRKLENRYYVAEFRKIISSNNVEKINLVYDVLNDGFCLYKTDYSSGSNPVPLGYFVENNRNIYFKYRTKEFKASAYTPQSQYRKGVYIKGKGDFDVIVYGDGDVVANVSHRENTVRTDDLKIIIHNIANKRYSTFSIEFVGLSSDAQIHDWEVYN